MKNMGKRHTEVETGVEEFEDTPRREHKCESDLRHKRKAAASSAANRRAVIAKVTTPIAREECRMTMEMT